MDIQTQEIDTRGIKFIAKDGDTEIGRAYLYLIHNDLHEEPAGYLEDMFVDEAYRGKKIGSQLLEAVLHKAKEIGCYKLVGTSRYGKEQVHEWYERFGFEKSGFAFRMDLSDNT